MRPAAATTALFLLALIGCHPAQPVITAPLVTGARTSDRPIEVLLLGTFHFAQVDTLEYDVLLPPWDAEVTRVVDALTAWRPDKLFLEWQPEFNQLLADSLLQAHRREGALRRRNEIYQLGIRTAARLDHERVFLVDHPGRYGSLYVPMQEYAQAHGQTAIMDGTAPYTHKAKYELRDDDAARRDGTLADYLQQINAPQSLASDHSVYVARFARIGTVRTDLRDSTGESRTGAELVADWYRRNVMIYSKVLKWMSWNERRIVIVIGSSHVPILRHLFETHGGFRVVEVADVLPKR